MKKCLRCSLLAGLLAICLACAPKHNVITPELQKQFNNDFKLGRINLDCELSCNWSWIISFDELITLHNADQWDKLAQKVMQIGRRIDIAYYFLGKSAEGLGYYDAALVYYRQSLILHNDNQGRHHCRSTNKCGGMYLPETIASRITLVQNIITPQKSIEKQTEYNSNIAAKNEKNNKPLSNKETLELKTVLHAKNACEMCSWPMPEKTKQEIRKYEEYYKKRTEGLTDPLLPGRDLPLYDMANAFAKGTINRPGLVVYCTDPIERKRYDEIVKSITPFDKRSVSINKQDSNSSDANTKASKNLRSEPFVKVDLSHIKKWTSQKAPVFEAIDGVRLYDDKNFRKAVKATIGKKRYDLFTSKEVQEFRYFQSDVSEVYGNVLYFNADVNNCSEKAFQAKFFVNPNEGYIDVIWGDTIYQNKKYKIVIEGKVIGERIGDCETKYKILLHDGTEKDIDIEKYKDSLGAIDFKRIYDDYK